MDRRSMLLVALVLVGQAGARSLTPSKTSLASFDPKISPPLHDAASDKKFFGPLGDYADDKRPVVQKHILDKLKSADQPYPALQSKDDFDSDFVKDENSDKGAWQAQFEYDALRRELAQEEGDEKRAEDRANREGRDIDGAQRDDDDAARKVADAQKDADAAAQGEKDAKTAEDFGGPPTHEKLEELKKAVQDAEAKYEQQKKSFEECKKQLEAAKKELEDLKVQQKAMEEKLAADTKLYIEQKTVKLNLRKAAQVKSQSEKAQKMKAAQDKLSAAEKTKADMEQALAKEKAQSEKAQKNLQKEKADLENVQKQLAAASDRLQKLHGYKPAQAVSMPTKSGAPMASVLLALTTIIARQML